MAAEQMSLPFRRISRFLGAGFRTRINPTTLVKGDHPVAVTRRKNDPLSSLPTEILIQIISYLTYFDRFNFKLIGSHAITAVLIDLPRPTFQTYLDGLSNFEHKNDEPISFPLDLHLVLNHAASQGHNALLSKLIHQELLSLSASVDDIHIYPATPSVDQYLRAYLVSAVKSSQVSTVQLLLKQGARNQSSVILNHSGDTNKNALEWAATNGHNEIVQLLLDTGAKVLFRHLMCSAIDYAAQNGHTSTVKLLSKPYFRHKGKKLSRALAEAARNGHVATVELLLHLGARIETNQYCQNDSPMHIAARGGNEDILRMLIKKGGKDSYITYYERATNKHHPFWSCLHVASYYGQLCIVELLLDEGLVAKDKEELRGSALALAAKGGHLETVKALLKRGFDVHAVDDSGTALHMAALGGHTEIMALLLDSGADINSAFGKYLENDGDRPLHKASRGGSIPATTLLLDRGADINVEDHYGNTALHISSLGGHSKIVDLLLNHGAETDTLNTFGTSVLYGTIEKNQVACLTLLLEHGASTELGSKYGDTGLHCAAQYRRSNLIPLLLQYGANIEAENHLSQRPFQTAALSGDMESIKVLVSSGADRHTRDKHQSTALHSAIKGPYASGNYIRVIPALIDYGLDVNSKDVTGKTPLHWAGSSRNRGAFQLLLSHHARSQETDSQGYTAQDYLDEHDYGWGMGSD